jgi:hypothetical protein
MRCSLRVGLVLVSCAFGLVAGCGDDGGSADGTSSGGDTGSSGSASSSESSGTSGATTTASTDGSGSSGATTGAESTTGFSGSSEDGSSGESSTGPGVDPPGYVVTVGDCELLWETTGLDEGATRVGGPATFRDVDGDGRRDLLTVRPADDSTTIEMRAGATGAVVDGFSVDGSASVLLVMDLDGDGTDDIVLHASTGGEAGGGVVEGDISCSVSAHSGVDGALLWQRADADASDCNFASSAVAGHDLDGDGLADIVAGWPFAAGLVPGDPPGRLVVIAASSGDTLAEYDAPIDAVGFGGRLLALGDVDGEPGDELAVSSFHYPGIGGTAVTVASPGAASDLWTLTDETESMLQLGAVVDANGDGMGDVVATLRELTFADGTQGLVHAADGATGEMLWQSEPNVVNGHYGIAIATVGDANGDGSVDVAAGVSHLLPNIPTYGIAGQFRILASVDGHVVAEVQDVADVDKISGFGGQLAAIDDPTDRDGAALVVLDGGQGPDENPLGILSAWSCLAD